MGYDFLYELCKIINNIPAIKYYKNIDLWSLCDKVTTFPKDIIDQSYRWMKKNEGKYEIKNRNTSRLF